MPRRKLKGKGKFKEFLGKANNFLKKSQILSKIGNAYSKYGGMIGLPYAQQVGGEQCCIYCGLWTETDATRNWFESCGRKCSTWNRIVCSRRISTPSHGKQTPNGVVIF